MENNGVYLFYKKLKTRSSFMSIGQIQSWGLFKNHDDIDSVQLLSLLASGKNRYEFGWLVTSPFFPPNFQSNNNVFAPRKSIIYWLPRPPLEIRNGTCQRNTACWTMRTTNTREIHAIVICNILFVIVVISGAYWDNWCRLYIRCCKITITQK